MGNPTRHSRETRRNGEITVMTPLWVVCRHLLAERGEEFFLLKDKVAETQAVEAVGHLRAASYRLSEALNLFGLCYPPGDIRRIGRSVSKIARTVDRIHNLDNAASFLVALADQLHQCRPHLIRLAAALSHTRDGAMKNLAKGTGKSTMEYKPLREQYLRLINSPFLSQKEVDIMAPAGQFVKGCLDEGWAEVAAFLVRGVDEGDHDALQALAEALTRLRYRLENVSVFQVPEWVGRLADVEKYRHTLQRIRDLDVFSGMVLDAGMFQAVEPIVLETIMQQRSSSFGEFQELLLAEPLFSHMPMRGKLHRSLRRRYQASNK